MAAQKYWRDAATVILAAKTGTKNMIADFDYRVLLLQRSGKMRFHSESFVFPGGVIDPADCSHDWGEVFGTITGKTLQDIADELGCSGQRPPVLCEDNILKDVPRIISMRITAIRETFEESGVLLLTTDTQGTGKLQKELQTLNEKDLVSWRKTVTEKPEKFLEMCMSLKAVPNVWALVEWSNWLTPVMKKVVAPPAKPKRFDTAFFLCCLENVPKVEVDTNEIVQAVWDTPVELLYQNFKEVISTGVPQRYEALRMVNFSRLQDLCTFAHKRAPLGVEQFLVVIVACSDGIIALYPGDYLYPRNPDYTGKNGVLTSDKTVALMRGTNTNLNRMERTGESSRFVCNFKNYLGHKPLADENEVIARFEAKTSRL